eukprot:TRINITY_DN4668_c0_g1_i2.p1 TRINITY_DN4668_c0_g1~~TRINITY_DN4668_c0_g1_i2.p1  ORF type:complete len:234 (+),score=52.55 TRINITY_DN4668_c0_g1_i2:495-1196(+)
MAVSDDTWLKEFGEAMKIAEEVQQKMQERREILRAGRDPSHVVAFTRRKITMLESTAIRLGNLLKDRRSMFHLSDKEVRMREEMLAGIRFKNEQVLTFLNAQQKASSSRAALLDQNGRPVAVETERTIGLDNRGILKMQTQVMQEQDEHLEGLLPVAGNVRRIANAINDELDVHDRILTDLDRDVETAQSHMEGANRQVAKMNRKGGQVCNLLYVMLIIVALVGILVVIIKYM